MSLDLGHEQRDTVMAFKLSYTTHTFPTMCRFTAGTRGAWETGRLPASAQREQRAWGRVSRASSLWDTVASGQLQVGRTGRQGSWRPLGRSDAWAPGRTTLGVPAVKRCACPRHRHCVNLVPLCTPPGGQWEVAPGEALWLDVGKTSVGARCREERGLTIVPVQAESSPEPARRDFVT